jgi:hypothetical protein
MPHWSVFGDRLGLFFYEDLQTDPDGFLRRILDFLQVDAKWQSPEIGSVSNAGGSPSGLSRALADLWRHRYAPSVAAVREQIGRVPEAWLL